MAPESGNRVAPNMAPHSFMWVYRNEIASGGASAVSTAIMFPLDSIKSRMQTYPYKGVLDCVRQSYAREGVAGFFRGTMSPMITITVARTLSFSVYTHSKHALSSWIKASTGFSVYDHVHTKGTYPNFYTTGCFAVSGIFSGAALSVFACPFELSKICTQVSVQLLSDPRFKDDARRREIAASYQQKGPFRCMSAIFKNRGFWGLYTGLNLHLARDIVGTVLYFTIYESCKQMGKTLAGDNPILGKLSILASGGLCGAMSWILIYPIDCSKSIYQKNALCYLRDEKVPARPNINYFSNKGYRGLGVSMARSFFANAIFFTWLEFTKKQIKLADGRNNNNQDDDDIVSK
jgi:hypothetical protein